MPRPGEGFEVVVARLDASPEELRSMRAWLCRAERRRAERLRFERHRRRFIVARARLRELLAARLGIEPAAVEFAYGANGKPRLVDGALHFSLSRCDDVALFAFSTAGEIGIDIEELRALPEADAIAARFFSRGEHAAYSALAAGDRPVAFLKCWTRKEALAKALGGGLCVPLAELDVSHARGWSLHNFSPLPGFIAAVARHHG